MIRRNVGLLTWLAPVVGLASLAAGVPGVVPVVLAGSLIYGAWHRPAVALEVGVLLVLVVRPWVDMYSERRLGLGAFASNPAVVVGLTVLGLAAVAGLHRARDGKRLWPDGAVFRAHGWLALAYGVGLAAGVFFYGQTGLAQGIREVVRVAGTVAAFLVVFWWAEEGGPKYARGWAYLAVGAALPISMALWQLSAGRGFLETAGFNRLQGTFSHPNSFGQFLIPFVLLALGEALAKGGTRQVFLGALASALTVLAVLTYSRTVIVALLCAVLVLPVLHARRLGSVAFIRSGALVLVFGLVAWWFAGAYVRERFANVSLGRGAVDAALAGQSENSYEWRLMNWSVLVLLGFEHPIVGHGAGMTTVLNPIVNSDNGVPYNAHNDFVRFFFEAGAIGLVAYLMYGILLCRWAARRARLAVLRRAPAAFAVAAAWVSLLLLTLGNTELSLHTANLYTLYGMLALIAGASRSDNPSAPPGVGYSLASDRPSS